MKRSLTIFTLLSLAGCFTTDSNDFPYAELSDDSSNLPKFELVARIPGYMYQLGENGEVLHGVTGHDNSELRLGGSLQSFNLGDYSFKLPPSELSIWKNGQSSVFPKNSFVGDKGEPILYLGLEPMRATIAGKSVDLEPILFQSGKFRYYKSNGKYYYRPIHSNEIRPLTGFTNDNGIIKRDLLISRETRYVPDPDFYITAPGSKTTNFKVPGTNLLLDYFDQNNFLASGQGKVVFRHAGTDTTIKSGSPSELYRYGSKVFPIGFAYPRKIGIGHIPCLWNQNGQPVSFQALCPELQNNTEWKFLSNGYCNILTNRRGDVAFEVENNMSGHEIFILHPK